MKKYIGVLLIMAVGIGLGYFNSPPPKSLERITIAEASQPAFALLYIAENQGFFADENVAVTFKSFTSGRDAIASALSGETDIATTFETPIVLRAMAGEDLAVITELHNSTQNTALLARRDRGISAPADLRGKTIAVTKNTNAEFFLNLFLQSEGLSSSNVGLVPTSPGDMARKLKEGSVDAVASWNPHVFNAAEAFPKGQTIKFTSDVYTEMSVLAGKRDVVLRRAEALRRVLRALVRAEIFMEANQSKALDIVASRLSDQPRAIIEQSWDLIERKLGLDHLLLSVLESQARWFRIRGHGDGPLPDFNKILLRGLLADVSPTAVTVRERPGD